MPGDHIIISKVKRINKIMDRLCYKKKKITYVQDCSMDGVQLRLCMCNKYYSIRELYRITRIEYYQVHQTELK